MNVFEESGRTIQLAFEGGQLIAEAIVNRPGRLARRLKAWLRRPFA
ncbi:MAG: hypothetical protein JOY66_02165 [Acetobacteraceae bacterium]|nr:hypothetical protein [Acetobacteraceae bacterium]